MIIELHDDSSLGPASDIVIPVLEAAGFVHHRRGELTVFERAAHNAEPADGISAARIGVGSD